MRKTHRHLRAALGLLTSLLIAGSFAASAEASQEITAFSSTLSTSQAGDHPDIRTSFTLKDPGAPEVAKNIFFNTPRGVFGNPSAAAQCSSVDFALDECPPSSQVGLITLRTNYLGNVANLLGTAPIYSVDPGLEEAARFAFIAPKLNIPIAIPVEVRSATDYGLRFTVTGITQLAPLAKAELTFWGFPASPSHDFERFPKGSPGHPSNCLGSIDTSCLTTELLSTVPLRPLTGNPSVCGSEPLPVTLDVQTYQDPTHLSHAETTYPPMSRCDRPTFAPVAEAKLTSSEADAPSGLDLTIGAPQALGVAASPSQIRSAIMTLPEELTINPDAADGQTACSDAEAGFGQEGAANCPDNSKIGTVTISSTALPGPLVGSMYFGEPKPGNQYRLLMMADGYGIHAKLVGKLLPDPKTGQLTAVFEDLPQLPFERFDLHLFASDRGVLATPPHCTLYTVRSHLFPWNDRIPDQSAEQVLSVNTGANGGLCPGQIRPFNPRLVAGTLVPKAGSFSSFTLKLDRDDGDQYLGDLNFKMPPGLTASLRGITYCPEAAIAQAAANLGRAEQALPSCPASSEIGTSNVAAGPGNHPFHAYGHMYLAGPFKGAPLSLVAVTPALAGPYDYGTVVVRVAISIDPNDAHVIAVSDTVPSIIGGVPIRMRSIQVNIDKPNFMINPTNCSPSSVDSQGIGDQGTVADFSSYFQAADCAVLPFAPKMSIKQLGGGKATKRAQDPGMLFELKTRAGDANLKSISVTLPAAFAIDQRNLGNICSEKELAAKQCAGRTPIGKAETRTPLLDSPLSGPVYAVSGSGGLPKLAFILDGQVSLVPRAETKTIVKNGAGKLQTTVPVVPDAPIGQFMLTVFGGKGGYLVNTRDICAKTPVTKIAYTSQNGKTREESVKVKATCGKKGTGSKRKRG